MRQDRAGVPTGSPLVNMEATVVTWPFFFSVLLVSLAAPDMIRFRQTSHPRRGLPLVAGTSHQRTTRTAVNHGAPGSLSFRVPADKETAVEIFPFAPVTGRIIGFQSHSAGRRSRCFRRSPFS